MLLIVKMGSTLDGLRHRGDFEAWIAEHAEVALPACQVVDVQGGEPLPPPGAATAVVVSGSHAMVSQRDDWGASTARWLRAVIEADIPLLAICYGHQLLAHAFGGVVGPNPRGRSFGTATFELTAEGQADRLLSPLGPRFVAHVSHSEAVLELPPGARLLAHSPHDPHAVFALGSRAWGVQFHPEFDAAITRAYIRQYSAKLAREGQDPDHLAQGVAETPLANALLARFASWARDVKGAHP